MSKAEYLPAMQTLAKTRRYKSWSLPEQIIVVFSHQNRKIVDLAGYFSLCYLNEILSYLSKKKAQEKFKVAFPLEEVKELRSKLTSMTQIIVDSDRTILLVDYQLIRDALFKPTQWGIRHWLQNQPTSDLTLENMYQQIHARFAAVWESE